LAVLKNQYYNEVVPSDFEKAHSRPCLIILNDLLNNGYSKEACDLFTKPSCHRNISNILITQNLFHQGRYCRDSSLNAKYLVVLQNVRDKNHFMFLARQVYPENSTSLFNAYLDATQRTYGYIISDLSQDTNDRLRFPTNTFPADSPLLSSTL